MNNTAHIFTTRKQESLRNEPILQRELQGARTIKRVNKSALAPASTKVIHPQDLSEKGPKLMTLSELASLPPAEWLLHGILPEQGLACLYGAPGSGKSFLALGMALCIATGTPWLGRRVKAGKVVYIAAEGNPASLLRRIEAWLEVHKIEQSQVEEDFYLWPGAVNLLDPMETGKLISRIQHRVDRVALLVVDTLARSFGSGDENSTKDMTTFIRNVDALRTALGATALLVHHSGKDATRGARGSIALEGACDTMMRLSCAGKIHTLQCEKQKDGLPFDLYKLTLVQQGQSAALQLAAGRATKTPLATTEQRLLDVLASPSIVSKGAPPRELRAAVEIHQKTLNRVLDMLCQSGLVIADGKPKSPNRRYRITPQGEAALSEHRSDMDIELDNSEQAA